MQTQSHSNNHANSRRKGKSHRSNHDWKAAKAEKVAKARKTIDEHVAILADQMRRGHTDQMKRFLAFTAKFHQYSLNNQLLIWAQCQEATYVAGVKKWNSMGRHVIKGERGLMIFAPMSIRRDKTESTRNRRDQGGYEEVTEERHITLFRPVYVFDVSQTDGDDLPQLIEAQGEAGHLISPLRKLVADDGIQLIDSNDSSLLPRGADGVSKGGEIVVNDKLDQPNYFRVLAHEYAHEMLHHRGAPRPDKCTRETEADAVAFVVCSHYGIDCDASDYLLSHKSDTDHLFNSLDRIRHTANEIIQGIEIQLTAQKGSQKSDGRYQREAVFVG